MCTGTGVLLFDELSLRFRRGCREVGVDGNFMDEREAARRVADLLRGFFNGLFAGPNIGEIDTAISFANEAVLTIWPRSSFSPYLVRPIYYAPKAEAVKPHIGGGIAGIAVISVLLGLQALGITILLTHAVHLQLTHLDRDS